MEKCLRVSCLGHSHCGTKLGSEAAICFSGLSWICPNVTVSLSFRKKPAQSKPGSGDKKKMSQKRAFREEPSNTACATPKKPNRLTAFLLCTYWPMKGQTGQMAGMRLSRHDRGVLSSTCRCCACQIRWGRCAGGGSWACGVSAPVTADPC